MIYKASPQVSIPANVRSLRATRRTWAVAAAALVALSACSTSETTTSEPVSETSVADPTTTADLVTTDAPAPTSPQTTQPPGTNPPSTDPPVTNPPVTDPPATDPPITNPPTTDPPVTDPPTTEPQPAAPTFNSFSVSMPDCEAAEGEPLFGQTEVTIHWDISDATSVYVAIDNEFGPYEQDLPLIGDLTVNHNCNDDGNTYFVVAENAIGRTVKQTAYLN